MKTKPQKTLEFKMNKQKQTFSSDPPINLSEQGKRLSAKTSFETTKSVLKITDENKSFLISTPVYWSSRGSAETIYKLQKFLELRPQNDIELHVEEVKKRGNQIKKEIKTINYLTLILVKTR